MLDTKNTSHPISLLDSIEKNLEIAMKAAQELILFLKAMIRKKHALDSAILTNTAPKYVNQIQHMKAIRAQCEQWLEIEDLTQAMKTRIYQCEFESIKLQRLSEEVHELFQTFSQ